MSEKHCVLFVIRTDDTDETGTLSLLCTSFFFTLTIFSMYVSYKMMQPKGTKLWKISRHIATI